METPNVVMDIGTGWTKMGFSGNAQPQFTIPTCVANSMPDQRGAAQLASADMNYFIGDEAYDLKANRSYELSFPIKSGIVTNWNDMERFLGQSFFKYLRVAPEDHNVLMAEHPFNSPEDRELMAEVMFETFNVKGLSMRVQAALALKAHQYLNDTNSQTCVVVDAGDSATHVVPICDGYVITSCIQTIPLGGSDVTEFINQMLIDRKEPVPADVRKDTARRIKETRAYFANPAVDEFEKFDGGTMEFKTMSGVHPKEGAWQIEMGYERFLAPEIFFNPEMFSDTVNQPLPDLIDKCILSCPMDAKRSLYQNIILAGGCSAITHFQERLEKDVKDIVDERQRKMAKISGVAPTPIEVKVTGRKPRSQLQYLTWLGGAVFAAEDNFVSHCHTKKEYDEIGPSCMRNISLLHGG